MANFDEKNFSVYIPMYNGELRKLHAFLSKCETFRNSLREMDKPLFFNKIIFKLEGRAFDVVQEASPVDYDAFKKALVRGIYAGRSTKDLDRKLENIRQNNFSVYEFAQRINEIVTEYRRIIADLETDDNVKLYRNKELEKKATRYFKEGLNEPLKTRVLASSIDSDLKKTIDLAMEEEPFAMRNQIGNGGRYYSRPRCNQRYNSYAYNNPYCNSYQRNNLNLQTERRRIKPGNPQPTENQNNREGNITCYRCNKNGHMARECTVKFTGREKTVKYLQEKEIWEDDAQNESKN